MIKEISKQTKPRERVSARRQPSGVRRLIRQDLWTLAGSIQPKLRQVPAELWTMNDERLQEQAVLDTRFVPDVKATNDND